MPYVQVPKDLAKIKTKVAFNLTKRQLICFGIAGVTALPTYFLTREAIGNMGAMLLLIVVAMPSFLVAMYEKNGLPFEKVAKTVIKSRFFSPEGKTLQDRKSLRICRKAVRFGKGGKKHCRR